MYTVLKGVQLITPTVMVLEQAKSQVKQQQQHRKLNQNQGKNHLKDLRVN